MKQWCFCLQDCKAYLFSYLRHFILHSKMKVGCEALSSPLYYIATFSHWLLKIVTVQAFSRLIDIIITSRLSSQYSFNAFDNHLYRKFHLHIFMWFSSQNFQHVFIWTNAFWASAFQNLNKMFHFILNWNVVAEFSNYIMYSWKIFNKKLSKILNFFERHDFALWAPPSKKKRRALRTNESWFWKPENRLSSFVISIFSRIWKA